MTVVKIVKRAAIGILLLLLVFWGFLEYRQYASYQNAIHKNADLVIKVNVDQLFRKIALNAVGNPGYYLKGHGEDSLTVEKEREDNGVRLPANIFAYTLKRAPNTFFSIYNVKDSSNFKHFLIENLQVASFQHNDKYTFGASENRKVQVAYNDERAVLSYTFGKKDIAGLLEEMLQGKDMMDTDSDFMSMLKEAKADVVAIQAGSRGEFNFSNGQVLLSGALELPEYFAIPSKVMVNSTDTSSTIHVWMAGNVMPKKIKNYTINNITIPFDSLIAHYNGYIDIEIAGTTLQRDSVVTYEFNDNFEKVATKVVEEKEVPGIRVLVNGDADHLKQLLEREKIAIDNKLNRAVLPLFDLNIMRENGATILFSNINIAEKDRYMNTNAFFNLYVNFNKLKQQGSLPLLVHWLKNLNDLKIAASKKDESVALEGQLSLTRKDVNALMLLID